MLVKDMKPGTVFRGPVGWCMRIDHPHLNCVCLSSGLLYDFRQNYEPVKHRFEDLKAKTLVPLRNVPLGTAFGCCLLKVAGGVVCLDSGAFRSNWIECQCLVDSYKVVICS